MLIMVGELIVILFLSIKVYRNITRKPSINPIKKDQIDFVPQDGLKYYYEPKPNTIETTGEIPKYNTSHHINNDSLSEDVDYQTKKSPGIYRIVTLGDSFTYGIYVATKDSWPKKLEDDLNKNMNCKNIDKFEVINLGVSGYDTAYEAERFKARGAKYDPDLVLWLMVDLKRVNEKIFPLALQNEYLKQSGIFEKITGKTNYYSDWQLAYDKTIKENAIEDIYQYQKGSFSEFKKIFNGKTIIIPTPWRLTNILEVGLTRDLASENTNTYLFDRLTNLDNTDALIPGDSHPNKKGHSIIAEDIFGYLKNNNFIDCL